MIVTPISIQEERFNTCNGCDKLKDMSSDPLYFFVDLVGNLIPDANKTMCSECSCPVWVKVKIIANTCPLNKWKE